MTDTDARRGCRRWSRESIDVDRSRKLSFRRTARKPAPMLVLRTLTVEMTVRVCGAAASASRINSLEGSLMIELGRFRPIGVYRGLSKSRPSALIQRANVCRDLSRSIAGDVLQSDGKSDGKNVALSCRRKFTVRSIFELTVNLECEVQHPCGFPGNRRIRRADGKCARSQAIARTRCVAFRGAAPSKGMEGQGTRQLACR